jgi:hypothetical protein
MYRVKNMTYQPLRLIFNNKFTRLDKRSSILVEELTNQIVNLYKKNFIQVKKVDS